MWRQKQLEEEIGCILGCIQKLESLFDIGDNMANTDWEVEEDKLNNYNLQQLGTTRSAIQEFEIRRRKGGG